MPVAFEQSAPLTYGLAALGGILEVCATAILAVPDAKKKQGFVMTPWAEKLALAGNIFVQTVGSLTSNLFAPWFGPVSIVGPMALSSQLVANMVIFGSLLGLDHFTKDMVTGTYVVLVATVLLPVVGPQVQKDQDIMLLFGKWYSILWFAVLNAGMLVAAGVLAMIGIETYSEWKKMSILLIARATSFAANLTVSRAFVLDIDSVLLLIFIVIKIVSGGIYTYAIVVQSTAVRQAKFIPLNATVVIVVNALTGIIIWEDWKVMQSWVGYFCVFWLLGLGCDLLLSAVPLLTTDNPTYGRRGSMAMSIREMPSLRRNLVHLEELDTIMEDYDDEEELENDDEEEANNGSVPETSENDDYDKVLASPDGYGSMGEKTPSPRRTPRRQLGTLIDRLTPVTKAEAWTRIYHAAPRIPKRKRFATS